MELNSYPPLVFAGEAERLKSRLAQVARGEAFVLQAGDNAETINGVTADAVRDTLRTMLQMSALLEYAMSKPVVKISRIAGRRGRLEARAHDDRPADGAGPPSGARRADSPRLVRLYQSSAATLNLMRAFTSGGYADLPQVHAWNQDFVAASPSGRSYRALTNRIGHALNFMRAVGTSPEKLGPTEFFASHEGLLLEYESALTRVDSLSGRRYDTSCHFVWIGESARDLDGAHLDYFATIDNPVGVVLGPDSTPDDALAYLDRLDPAHEPGRLTFIVRLGAAAVRDKLPALIEKVSAQGHQPAWICDPMHHDASGAPTGDGTRLFDDVLDEVKGFFEVHRALGTHPGGIHIELTGDERSDRGLGRHSGPGSGADALERPCLTHAGSLDLAFLIAEITETHRSAAPAPLPPADASGPVGPR